LLAFSLSAHAAPPAAAGPMPPLAGEFLTGRKAALPGAAKGKVTLLALGFTYDSRFAVEDWVKQWRKQFGSDPRTTFFEVPMIGGMARMGKWFIDSGMRKGTPVADHEHVVTVYGGTGEWKSRLGCNNSKPACLVLLDPQGNIRWTKESLYDERAWDELKSQTDALLQPSR
jgi:hypothetical protein